MQGDITEENTDAIINPTDNKFALEGAISKKILEKGGRQIVNDCATLVSLKDFAMAKAVGQLKCKQVVHVLSPQNMITRLPKQTNRVASYCRESRASFALHSSNRNR